MKVLSDKGQTTPFKAVPLYDIGLCIYSSYKLPYPFNFVINSLSAWQSQHSEHCSHLCVTPHLSLIGVHLFMCTFITQYTYVFIQC